MNLKCEQEIPVLVPVYAKYQNRFEAIGVSLTRRSTWVGVIEQLACSTPTSANSRVGILPS